MFSGRPIALVCAAVIFFVGCDANEQQDTFAEEASRPPSGFTHVRGDGEVVDVDEDDWRTAPVYLGEIRIDPAEPNPVSFSDFVSLRVTVTVFDAVRAPLRVEARFEGTGRLTTLDVIEEAASPGAYAFMFPASAIGATGLHRLFVFDGIGEIVSYGDLMIQ